MSKLKCFYLLYPARHRTPRRTWTNLNQQHLKRSLVNKGTESAHKKNQHSQNRNSICKLSQFSKRIRETKTISWSHLERIERFCNFSIAIAYKTIIRGLRLTINWHVLYVFEYLNLMAEQKSSSADPKKAHFHHLFISNSDIYS